MARKTLTPKERRFVDAYMGSAHGNGSLAARLAGYAPKSARITASQLLTKPNVAAELVKRQAKEERVAIANAEERDQRLSHIIRKSTDEHVVVRAAAEMNKCEGRHTVKHEITGRIKLEQILTNSLDEA